MKRIILAEYLGFAALWLLCSLLVYVALQYNVHGPPPLAVRLIISLCTSAVITCVAALAISNMLEAEQK